MGKDRRRNKDDYDGKREERLLDQIKNHGRKPTAKPGKFHTPKSRPNNRRSERKSLKDAIHDYNSGETDYDG